LSEGAQVETCQELSDCLQGIQLVVSGICLTIDEAKPLQHTPVLLFPVQISISFSKGVTDAFKHVLDADEDLVLSGEW